MSSALEDAVAPPYRSVVRTMGIFAAAIGGFFVAQDRAANFVDERVRVKTAAADKVMEMQVQRLEKLDVRLDELRLQMREIKAEVGAIRGMMEQRHSK